MSAAQDDEQRSRAITQFLAEDRVKLLSTFPAEIWAHVFDQIEDVSDYASCFKASTSFKEALESRRSVYLFPEVVRILSERKAIGQDDWLSLLNCRLVCKIWKDAVDALLQSPSSHHGVHVFNQLSHKEELELAHHIKYHRYDNFTSFFRFNQIRDRAAASAFTQKNPFPSRSLKIDERKLFELFSHLEHPGGIWERHRNGTNHLLQKIGHHFWYASVDIGVAMISYSEWYLEIIKIIQNTANLKSLTIGSSTLSDRANVYWRLLPEILPPFPSLANLEMLTINDLLPPSLMNAILSANNHIKTLIIPGERNGVPHATYPALYHLNISDLHIFSACLVSWRELESMSVSWNLKVLRLDLTNSDLYWSTIFEKLECYRDTLVELYLAFPDMGPTGRHNSCKISWEALNLPNVKKLDVDLGHCPTLDFLLGMTSLNHFSIWVHESEVGVAGDANKTTSRINFPRLLNQTVFDWSECNIWELIPSLAKINSRGMNGGGVFSFKRGSDGVISVV